MTGQNVTMGRPEAAMRLMRLGTTPGVGEQDVVALQVAFRSLAKRHFDNCKHWARRHSPRTAASSEAVPAAAVGLDEPWVALEELADRKPDECLTPVAIVHPPFAEREAE